MSLIIPASQTLAASGYDIDNSCRFNDDDSAKLVQGSFQPSSAYTVSFWIKRGKLGTSQYIYRINSADYMAFTTSDTLEVERRTGSFTTAQVFRDPSAWYHIHLKSTSSVFTVYVNGVQAGTNTSASNPYTAGDFAIGTAASSAYLDGYLAEFHWIDGSSLDPDSFGEEGDYGEWKPIEYEGSHGTDGFYLDFSNNATKHAITTVGNTNHSTTQKKIGDTSIYFDGTGDYLTVADSADWDFGTGDFTVEFWGYNLGGSDSNVVMFGDNTYKLTVGYIHTSTLVTYISSNGSSWDLANAVSMGTFPSTSWVHYALVRNGTSFKTYRDGTEISSFTSSATVVTGSGITIGRRNTDDLSGYVDEIRVSNTARYTSGFTPSTTAFTDDANTLLLIQSDTTNGSTTFTDSSGVTGALGNDSSGEDNHFTATNITASDQMTDTPTNNFCAMNPLNNDSGITLSEGDLKWVSSSHDQATASTMAVPSTGKFYWEVYVANMGGTHANVGIASAEQVGTLNVGDVSSFNAFAQSGHRVYIDSGYKAGSTAAASNTAYGASWTTGDIIGVAVDMDAPSLTFYKNNASQGASHTDISLQTWIPLFATYSSSSSTFVANFGQDGTFAGNKTAQGNADGNGYGNFYYAPPSSHLALCSQNLPEPTVTPSEHFNTILYDDGAGAKTGVGFQPDLVWLKSRGSSYEHELTDAVRGVTKALSSDSYANIESTDSTGLTAFGSDGFTVGTDNNYDDTTGDGMVAWNWKANGSGSSNTDGTINTTSTSANVSAGFSISTYTGNGTVGATVGHGLSVAPQLVIVKRRDNANNWVVGQAEISGKDWTGAMKLDDTEAWSGDDRWDDTAPTSSVFSLSDDVSTNNNTSLFVAYCWHSVEGYSKIGGYEGNGSATAGTFVYCGFRPAFIITKSVDSTSAWQIFDSKREGFNVDNDVLEADATSAETTTDYIDILSNGFKSRITTDPNVAESYIYMAFAETPFKYANAR